jgi:zinc-binding alcohol dehydrogenase family protein
MRAVGYRKSLPIQDPLSLEDLEVPAPEARPHDVVVRVQAVSVNPVDTKVRKNRAPAEGVPQILGWDAVGVVESVGAAATRFAVGDRVYYAGAINRPGSNSELHAVDERIIARAPRSLADEAAAALPLTSITAYELLFDRLRIAKGGGDGQTLLITGGAGGVGSILIQLARQLTQLRVVATASRPETRAWCEELGAHAVIDHGRSQSGGPTLAAQLKAAGLPEVDCAVSLTQTAQHYEQLIEALRPQGQLALIDDTDNLNAMKLKSKSLSLHWELMFTRSLYDTPDLAEQGKLLAEIADLVDAGRVRSTATASFGRINAENLRRAHAQIESGTSRGKLVLAGW